MQNNQAKHYFNSERNLLINELKRLEKYKEVNNFLKQHDWLFISPIFFQGFELDYFFELSKTKSDCKTKITELIFRKFYNLSWTASFIDDYCKRCSYIEPFLKSIEHSVILTFQRDYEGGIKTLIPIIEGILRQYLNKENRIKGKRIEFQHLKKSIEYLRKDVVESYKIYISNYLDENNNKIDFNINQINRLVKLQTQYYEIWFSFIKEFIEKSFYLETYNGEGITNELNRHVIDHALLSNIDFNLENYIKVYFVIQFLSWILLIKEGKSLLNEIRGFRFIEKIIAYERIIKLSDKLLYEKHLLLKEYSGYDSEALRKKLKVSLEELSDKKTITNYKSLKKIDKLVWEERLR